MPIAIAAAFAMLHGACSSEDTTNPGNTNTTTCGEGTKLENGACVPSTTTETVSCGPGTTLKDNECVADETTPLVCGDGTALVDGVCEPTALVPGKYMPPLVHLQRVYNPVSNHMHLDEVRYRASDQKLFVCSYTFEVLNAADPGNMKYISGANGLKVTIPAGGITNPKGGTRTGGCINLSWDDTDNDVVYTTHKGNIDDPAYLGAWRLTPSGSAIVSTQLPMLQEPGVSYEGVDVANGKIYVALHEGGLGVFDRNPADDTISRIGTLTGLDDAITVRVVGTTAFVAQGLGGLATVDVSDPTAPKLIGEVVTGGTARDVRVNGNTAYLAAGSAGLVVVDVSDLANPTVIGSAAMPGSAIRLDYSSDRVYVAGWNDARVFDVTVPATPLFIGAGRMTEQLPGTTTSDQDDRPEVTNRVLGIAGDGDILFAGAWHAPHTFRIHADRKAPWIYLQENLGLLDFGPTEVGKSSTQKFNLSNDGNAPLTVTNIWANNGAYTASPTQVLVEPGASAEVTLTFTPTTTDKATSTLNISSDDPAQALREGWLVGNQPGLGVGVPVPDTLVDLTDGSQWVAQEHIGEVMVLAYFATF